MENCVGQKVIEKIKKAHIEPKPKLYFKLLQAGLFMALGVVLVLGAVSIGIFLEYLQQTEILSLMNRPGGIAHVFFNLPYAWIILLIVVIILAVWEYRQTKLGYRCSFGLAFLGVFLGIIIGGGILCAFGFCFKIEETIRQKYSGYSALMPSPRDVWLQPELGLLSGMIIADDERNKKLELRDWEADIWNVDYYDANIRLKVEKREGEYVKILGKKEKERNFKAEEIRPWRMKKNK